LIRELGDHWTFLGLLSPVELTVFFQEAHVTVLPSINETESFGMVQVEAMYCGTPVAATDLPGVRVPVSMTGMGKVVPPGDAASLAEAILAILENRRAYTTTSSDIPSLFSTAAVAQEYENIFRDILKDASD
jgi:glycosyltransferase involved in cell wall biosynthesis